MASFYEDPNSFPYIERAVLMEDIKLPVYNNKKKLNRSFFYNAVKYFIGSYDPYVDRYCNAFASTDKEPEYKLAYNELRNIQAKFYIPVLMTTFTNNGTEVKVNNKAPSTAGFKGNIKALAYSSSNCTVLTIPKYIVMQFVDQKEDASGNIKEPIIPKGTEFLIAAVGGVMRIDHIRIIGLYTLVYDKNNFPQLKDEYYGGNKVK